MNWLALIVMVMVGYSGYSTLDIVVTDAVSDEGVIRVLLFDNEKGFPDQPEWARSAFSLPIKEGRARVSVEKLLPGSYAVAVFHDHDGDGKMRKGLFGIPRDRYGFSNNVMGTMGPPSFEKAAIVLGNKDKTVFIRLKD
ncbi:DUF2141 domain-containing protein [Negadavirga shengliensis]|uniref:DUF2141 domain-containing protein n=1 Tax=Negadavirga shengliensis TaxID=1389218 RepID=A0ABV9T7B1_9BACT